MHSRWYFSLLFSSSAIILLTLNAHAQTRVDPQRPVVNTQPGVTAPVETPNGERPPDGERPATVQSSAVPPASASAAPSAPANGNARGDNPDLLLIGAGDLLEVAVFGAPDYNNVVRVADSGEVSLPLLGPVKLGGMSTNQAERLLEKQFSERGLFTNPQVSVFVKEYATQGISVAGEVQKPGIYPLVGPRSVMDAISVAGGAKPTAGEMVTITHRSDPKHPVTVKLTTDGATPIKPGDTVVLSKAGLVYVVGDVRLPGGFIVQSERITVLQALAMAQGANVTASLDHAKVIRREGDTPSEVPIRLKDILSSKAPDVVLKGDDILFVPRSGSKSAAMRSLEAIVQTATGLAIYGGR
jgi:polysaccharide biosynthesis/export protein